MNDKELVGATLDYFNSTNTALKTPSEASNSSVEAPVAPEQYDLAFGYEKARRERLNASKRQYPRGASAKTTIALMVLLDNLRPRYHKAKDESEHLKSVGDTERARIAKAGYMEDVFLPALESLVNLYGIDEILNNRTALKKLDEMVLIDGGSGSGYSEAFIKSLHGGERGIAPAVSDGVVVNAVRDIKKLVARDQIRAAVGLAKRVKGQIERGEHSAEEADWELISAVALRG